MSNEVKDISDLQSESYLQSADVDRLIADLEKAPREQWEDDDSYEADMGALAELKEFRDEVSGYAGAARWNNGMSLIRDSAWGDFAEDEAESLYGREAVQSGYFNLTGFTEDLQSSDYQSAELNGVTFWYRN
jgi:hypothetical protein